VLFYWYARWRRVTSALRGNLPVTSGREFEVLRGLEKNTAIAGEVKLVVSNAALEPGIVGVFHPILLLPSGIADRLTDAELQAIIIHELCHVRRRDNLSAALHMLVEAIFWLHPLVWWIGSHLVDERERACDEQVLLLGGDPQTYAESILKVCEFYLESPLPCTAGVTGSNLKRRIEAIMLHRAPLNLDLRKKLLLTAMAAMVLAGPIVIGILNPAPSRAQSKPAPTANSAPKYVLGDLRIDGDVHDRDGVRERVLKAWKDREYDDAEELASEVVGVGVRMDIQDRGYFKMVASEPVSQPLGVSDGKQRLLVTTSIVEGKQYHLGQLFIQSSEPDHALKVPAQTLKEQFQLRSGDLFKVSEIRSGMEKAMALYHTQGFADANIQPATSIDESHQLINLTLRVTEGPHS
jgi:hypothetical protein